MPDIVPVPHVERTYRFATIPEWVLRHPDLSPLAVRLYLVLDRHGQDPANCYPSHARLAEWAGCEERSVQRPLKQLVEVGAIEIVARFTDEGRQTSNRYRLAGEIPLSVPARASERGTGRAEARATTRASARGEGEQEEREPKEGDIFLGDSLLPLGLSAETPTETEVRATKRAKGYHYPHWFDAFWSIWPNTEHKRAAFKALVRALAEGAEIEEVIRRAKAWDTYWDATGREDRYKPQAASWLNGGGWETDPPPLKPLDHRSQKQRQRDAFWAQYDHDDPIPTTATETDPRRIML